jgi:poly-gamma-glutamate synthesis protein (capsule biosynthesis protein)
MSDVAAVSTTPDRRNLVLCLAGDVMTGRGIDQILPRSCDPRIYESYLKSAADYVALADDLHGRIPRPASFDYVWGDALSDLARRSPDLFLVNLETAITDRGTPEPKGINYRMHPANIGVISAARIDACTLANNHALDWGRPGLIDTIDALMAAGVGVAGAGRTAAEASAPLLMPLARGLRALILGLADRSSGIPGSWAATRDGAGVNLLGDLSAATVRAIASTLDSARREGDLVIASIHWGSNWGHRIPAEYQDFARALIDEAGVDLVHGHSSHHARAIEVYRGKLILYGCGDLIDDYEGIHGHEALRGDLVALYFAEIDPAGRTLMSLEMLPYQSRAFSLRRASEPDVKWLAETLTRVGSHFCTGLSPTDQGALGLSWR